MKAADDLVARRDRVWDVRQFSVLQVQVGAADPAGLHLEQHLSWLEDRQRRLNRLNGLSGCPQTHDFHRLQSGDVIGRLSACRASSDPSPDRRKTRTR
jgi:hypothetical protein